MHASLSLDGRVHDRLISQKDLWDFATETLLDPDPENGLAIN